MTRAIASARMELRMQLLGTPSGATRSPFFLEPPVDNRGRQRLDDPSGSLARGDPRPYLRRDGLTFLPTGGAATRGDRLWTGPGRSRALCQPRLRLSCGR